MTAVSAARPPSAESAELLAELRALAARMPMPQPAWHPHVAHIRACHSDLLEAVEAAARDPVVLDIARALLDDPQAQLDSDASEDIAAAWARLETLPLPEGQHPYLDEILPAVEALRVLLVALTRRQKRR